MGSRGLMDRESVGLETRGNPRLWVRIPALAGTEVKPLSKAPNPQLLPVGCLLLHLDGSNAENTFHSSLYSV